MIMPVNVLHFAHSGNYHFFVSLKQIEDIQFLDINNKFYLHQN